MSDWRSIGMMDWKDWLAHVSTFLGYAAYVGDLRRSDDVLRQAHSAAVVALHHKGGLFCTSACTMLNETPLRLEDLERQPFNPYHHYLPLFYPLLPSTRENRASGCPNSRIQIVTRIGAKEMDMADLAKHPPLCYDCEGMVCLFSYLHTDATRPVCRDSFQPDGLTFAAQLSV
ncbi:hypothetical protein BDW22DRAFT_316440 [Trametopsis cervina]|nr:hypothetical protein BDW22DRAFT_316440 [Trametopsis cervina]